MNKFTSLPLHLIDQWFINREIKSILLLVFNCFSEDFFFYLRSDKKRCIEWRIVRKIPSWLVPRSGGQAPPEVRLHPGPSTEKGDRPGPDFKRDVWPVACSPVCPRWGQDTGPGLPWSQGRLERGWSLHPDQQSQEASKWHWSHWIWGIRNWHWISGLKHNIFIFIWYRTAL